MTYTYYPVIGDRTDNHRVYNHTLPHCATMISYVILIHKNTHTTHFIYTLSTYFCNPWYLRGHGAVIVLLWFSYGTFAPRRAEACQSALHKNHFILFLVPFTITLDYYMVSSKRVTIINYPQR